MGEKEVAIAIPRTIYRDLLRQVSLLLCKTVSTTWSKIGFSHSMCTHFWYLRQFRVRRCPSLVRVHKLFAVR